MSLESLRLQEERDRVKELYDIAWRKPFESVFEKRDISPSEGDSTPVPRQCLVCRALPGDPDVDGILVRNEYLQALQDIIVLSTDYTARFPVHGEDTASALPLEFTNPFLCNASTNEHKVGARGVAVLGQPGIGKSLFLQFVLCLRMLAGQPTVFQNRSKSLYIVNDDGVFLVGCARAPYRAELRDFVPEAAWCLADDDVSVDVLKLGCFIVHAAPPRRDSMAWLRKKPTASKYFVKPWSLPELLAGATLQKTSPWLSARALVDFVAAYGPAPRPAYALTPVPQKWAYALEEAAAAHARPGRLEDALAAAACLDDDAAFGFPLFVVVPGAHRNICRVVLPSRHVWKVLRHVGADASFLDDAAVCVEDGDAPRQVGGAG